MNEMITKEIYTDDGDAIEVEFPSKFEICSRCEGHGKHVNPSIDSHGISEEEWRYDWSEEEREGYFNGAYDVICHTCKGQRVVAVVDEDRLNEEQKKNFKTWQEQDYERAREAEIDARIMRMECGGYG